MSVDSTLHLCDHLQCKALMGRRFRSSQDLETAMMHSDSQFTCLHTTQPWGPDQDLCAPEYCQPGRACFAMSARDPGAAGQS
ncbi:MAG: hypothetical protein GXP62_19690 [Oligoflexia bacterium]|nr:hypothetical protein [Oligoflexia bacterium]